MHVTGLADTTGEITDNENKFARASAIHLTCMDLLTDPHQPWPRFL